MSNRNYQQCTRCIMDTTDTEIIFDKNGVCNHCHQYDRVEKELVLKGDIGKQRINEIIAKIKAFGKGKKYDCLIGLSGGVDSTYIAYLVKKYKLRALAIHFDNGWNSDLFLNISESEGVPFSIMEALSAGIPVMATDVGGTAEIIDDTVGRLLPKELTPVLLRQELINYHQLPKEEKEEKANNAFNRYFTCCNTETLTRKLAKELEDLV